MSQLLCRDLWKTIRKLAKRPGRKRAAIAYVSSDEHIQFGEGDTLVTDASDGAIESGQTSAKVLSRAWRRGAALYSMKGLHAKVLLFRDTAVIGSANLSQSSTRLTEAAWITRDAAAAAMASTLIEDLADASNEIDAQFIERIMAIKVVRTGYLPGPQVPEIGTKKDIIPQAWIVGLHELSRDYEDEAELAEMGEAEARSQLSRRNTKVTGIRIVGKSRFRQQISRGHILVQLWRPAGVNHPTLVYKPTTVLHCQEEPTCTRVFVEGREKNTVPWRSFQRILSQIGLGDKVRPNSLKPISLETLRDIERLWPKSRRQ